MRSCHLLPIALAAAVLALVVVRPLLVRRPLAPAEISLWYWHSPFRIGRQQARDLETLGVRRLFVRAGTISASGDAVRLILPQTWELSPGSPALHLVFALDGRVVRRFDELSVRAVARCVASSYASQRKTAESVGLEVGGVQVDFDCATRLLRKYADLLRRIRRELPKGTVLSITSLPTWFASPDIQELLREVDFYCPQFYETRIAPTLSEARPVSDPAALANGLEAAGRLGTPFYAGVPAYGHAFMFDHRGRLIGTYREMSAPEAARHPSFRLARSWPADASGRPAAGPKQWVGEDFVDFVAVQPGTSGKGLGYHLFYSLPTARMVSLNLDIVRDRRPADCLGAVIFRHPEPDEVMTLPLPCFSAVIRNREARMKIRTSVRAEPSPWQMVEGDRSGAASDVTVSLANTGNAASFPSADSVKLTLRFDAPGVEAEPGDFDSVELLSASGLRAGPARASVLVCKRFRLRAGETISVGPVDVSAAHKMHGEWRVETQGGFVIVTGKMDLVEVRKR